ncbi:protein-L-isoaspartate(D-aspartate) O-methyltransferase [Amycolatopsis antarctica]|uniref:Protein-L-isoaspartate O-methyltransferase n=1 Tax=Amycolatopsis antarctica TaxID=1854586 RepID=A0A263D159_9PSEU|nr:methyltransferase domain-containing protein [Amycolatopsis antarctica]OZM72214.1 protein-L-isoaspartate(D-aspartate) O-methyltransferase [Amycolatopsis antarctica]
MSTEQGVRALVAALDSAGDLPAGFGPLLERVPREKFIPDRIWVDPVPIDRATDPERWHRAVYSDTSIVTQFDNGRTCWPEVGDRPTCSASMPSVVAGMLDALDVHPGHTVLEIGTGTGYNAALLSELVGPDGSVVTLDIDHGIAEQARARLTADPGFPNVRTLTSDATNGASGHDPFDRTISTMAVPLGRIPLAWIAQSAIGGLVLTPVRADLTNGPLILFTADENTATGITLPMGVAFMESRTDRTPRPPRTPRHDHGPVDETTSDVDSLPMLDDPSSRWALAVAMPSCRYDIDYEGGKPVRAWLHDPLTGSHTTITKDGTDRCYIRQSGPRHLWDEAEIAYRWWDTTGRPHITDWQWTITPEGQHTRPRSGATKR